MKNLILTLTIITVFIGTALGQIPVPLSGPYTVDPSLPAGNGNYQTLTAFSSDLNDLGVIGAVTCNIKDGTYNERIELLDIIGASTVNNITFQSDPGNSAPVIINNVTSSSTAGTITLQDSKFINFKDLTITCQSSLSYRRMVYFKGNLSDIRFENCEFIAPTVTSTSTLYALFYGTGYSTLGEGFTFESCNMTGGSDIYNGTANATTKASKLNFYNCEMVDNYGDWIYGGYITQVNLIGNKFYPASMNTTSYILYIYHSAANPGDKVNIQRNDIRVDNDSYMYGMSIRYYAASAADPSLIANNFIQSLATGSIRSRYAFYLNTNANLDISNNSVKFLDGNPTSSRIIYSLGTATAASYTPGNYRVRNNIFTNYVSGTSGNLIYASGAAAAYFSDLSNNLYHAPNSTNPWYYGTASHATLNSWSLASGEVNSQYGDPQFLGPNNLHVEGFLASTNGIPLANVTEDFDQDPRPLPAGTDPDVGADEFVPPTCPSPVNLQYVGGDTTSATFSWNSVNSTEWELEYDTVGFTPGTGTIVIVNTNPATLSGLPSRQFFDIYIRSICAVGDTSRQNGPAVFNTFGQGIYMDSDTSCGPGFIDITNTGTDLDLTDDEEFGLALPFPWLVQGEQIDFVNVSNNGGLVFNQMSGQIYYTMAAGQGMYPFIQDLDNDISGVNQIGVLWDVLGTAPNRQFVLMWKDRTRYPGYLNTNPCTFEIIYEEATSEFYYIYKDVDMGKPSYDYGGDAEIGVRGSNQDIDISINNTTYLQNHSCVRFFYTNCPKPTNFILAYVDTTEAGVVWSPGLSNETDWVVTFGPAGFDPTTSGTSFNVSNTLLQIPNLQPGQKYDVYIGALCASGDTSEYLFGSFTTNMRCGNPYDIDLSPRTDSLISNWQWNGQYASIYPLTGFNLMYDEYEYDVAAGSSVALDDNFSDTTLDQTLMPGGVYDVYLQAVCGTYLSDTIGPLTIIMPLDNDNACGAYELPVDGQRRIFSNEEATTDQNEQGLAPPVTGTHRKDGWANNEITYSVWYTFEAPSSGNLRIDASDREFNGQIALYEVGACGVLNSYVLLAANEDEIESNQQDSSEAPNFTYCGLNPGQTYYVLYDSYSTDFTGIYTMRLSEISLVAGTFSSDTVDLCTKDTFNLYNTISNYSFGGTWIDTDNSYHIIQDSLFNTNGLAYGAYTFEYRVEEGCAFDSVLVECIVYEINYAGTDGTLDSICRKQPFNLYSGLTDLVDHSGTWYDFNGNAMADGSVKTWEIENPGTYTYLYVVENGVCPTDSSFVTVIVKNCDYTGIDEAFMQSVRLYPNPTSNYTILEWSDELALSGIKVTDMNGKLIQTYLHKEGTTSLKLDLSGVEPGAYSIQIITENGIGHTRIIKQ
jgi:hypothetical protein